MATAPPIVRQGPDFDNYSTNVDFYYQNAMDRPADASNPPEAFSALYNSRAVSKRARSSDEEDALTEAAPAIEDDGRKKRSRGRPRLDTKDETAADRRRTQIRLAQRAYRHRKDTAITTLEQRVKELERANEDMGKDFHDFYGVLVSQRVLDTAPHAVPQLSSIANKILNAAARAKTTDSDGSGSDGGDGLPVSSSGQQFCSNAPAIDSQLSPPAPSTAQPEYEHQVPAPVAFAASAEVLGPSAAVPPIALGHHVQGSSLQYEVVTEPTSLNASFPFYSSMESSSMGGALQGNMMAAPSPYGAVASPVSYSACELTFGRRLHRQTLERALRLILMPSPPPDRFAAVFGFCLFFESKAAIIKRLETAMSRSQWEDLNNWKAPFTNLGGAGTFFPNQSPPSAETTGNGNATPARPYGKPQPVNGMSMGPWGAEVQATRDQRIDYGADRRMQMMLAGFEGDFFDPEEVETYLGQIGIFIPQRADFVEAEVNLNDLGAQRQQAISPRPALSVSKAQQPVYDGSDSGYNGSAQSAAWTTNSNGSFTGAAGSTSKDYDCGGLLAMMVPAGVNAAWPQAAAASWPGNAKITLDVNVLIRELTNNSVCLGRTPGVRRKDIGHAIQVAAGLVPVPTPQ